MNEKITLQDIVTQLTDKQGINKKEAEVFVRNMFDLIEESLGTDKYVKVKGLGTFKLTEVDSRESVNVNTGERIEIQGHTKISFTPDNTMKELINKPFSHFETVILNDGVMLEDTPTEDSENLVETEEISLEPFVSIPQEEEKEHIQETIVTEEKKEEETGTQPPVPEAEIMEAPIEEPKTEVQEEVQETIEKKKDNDPSPVTLKEKDESSPFLRGIIVLLILIILGGAYWLFLKPSSTTEKRVTTTIQETMTASETKTEVPTKDTVEVQPVPEKIVSPTPVAPVQPMQAPKNERVPSLADTLEYQIVGTQTTYTLQNGETIIKASLKFFGTKKFWPYIAKHNRDTFKDADNIPVGAQIKIPELAPRN